MWTFNGKNRLITCKVRTLESVVAFFVCHRLYSLGSLGAHGRNEWSLHKGSLLRSTTAYAADWPHDAVRPKPILNSNLAKSLSTITSATVVQSFWNFTQSTDISLLFCAKLQNDRAIAKSVMGKRGIARFEFKMHFRRISYIAQAPWCIIAIYLLIYVRGISLLLRQSYDSQWCNFREYQWNHQHCRSSVRISPHNRKCQDCVYVKGECHVK